MSVPSTVVNSCLDKPFVVLLYVVLIISTGRRKRGASIGYGLVNRVQWLSLFSEYIYYTSTSNVTIDITVYLSLSSLFSTWLVPYLLIQGAFLVRYIPSKYYYHTKVFGIHVLHTVSLWYMFNMSPQKTKVFIRICLKNVPFFRSVTNLRRLSHHSSPRVWINT